MEGGCECPPAALPPPRERWALCGHRIRARLLRCPGLAATWRGAQPKRTHSAKGLGGTVLEPQPHVRQPLKYMTTHMCTGGQHAVTCSGHTWAREGGGGTAGNKGLCLLRLPHGQLKQQHGASLHARAPPAWAWLGSPCSHTSTHLRGDVQLRDERVLMYNGGVQTL